MARLAVLSSLLAVCIMASGRDVQAHPAGPAQSAEATAASYVALVLNPNSTAVFYNRGTLRLRAGDLDGAISDLDRVLALDPRHVAAYNNRGIARAGKGDPEGAIADFIQVTRIDSKRHEAYVNLGFVRLEQGRVDEARRNFARSISLRPSVKALIDTHTSEIERP
ncbi:MAG TPA: tetratricopeptide repeat protein [Terriglobia bacterium]|nr:tetratricopeptide repeat protein [Terriglobia bacterium]